MSPYSMSWLRMTGLISSSFMMDGRPYHPMLALSIPTPCTDRLCHAPHTPQVEAVKIPGKRRNTLQPPYHYKSSVIIYCYRNTPVPTDGCRENHWLFQRK